MKLRPLSPRLLGLVSGLLAGAAIQAAEPIHPAMTLLSASDPRFQLEGRFDRTDPAQPVITWSGSRLRLDFSGRELALVFGASTGQCVFDFSVDGAKELVNLKAGPGARFAWTQPLGEGRHHLVIFKRTEAAKGHAAFAGVQLATGAQAWAPGSPAYRLKMEFLGDSITAGACNEDGAVDQWDDYLTHNHALSYGCLTSLALAADHRAMAVSGMGVITGWEPQKAGEVWDKFYPQPTSARADLAAWQPDVAFVNLGENDDSYTRANHQPFPPDFTAGYVQLVRAIRAAYPHARIVLLRGGMFGGAKSPAFQQAWEAAVRELENGDPKMTHFVFQHWSELHPRVSDDRAMAAELTAWLKQQSFMTPYLKSPQ